MRFFLIVLGLLPILSLSLPLLDVNNDKTFDKLASLINQLNQTIQIQNQEIAGLKTLQQSSQVAFYATLSKTTTLGQHQIIEFDRVITNIGNSYDVRHGHFTAPINGIYIFGVSVMGSSGSGVLHVSLVKNGADIGHTYSDGVGLGATATSAFVQLNAGDMVWVKHMDGLPSEGIYGNNYCSFGGALISKI